jgi:hypothetical protein
MEMHLSQRHWGLLPIVLLAAPLFGQAGPAKKSVSAPPPVDVTAAPAPPVARSLNLPALLRFMPQQAGAADPGPPPNAAPLPAIPLTYTETLERKAPDGEPFQACRGEGAATANPLVGIKGCDVVLALPPYQDFFWVDRGTLLQQRALLLLRLGNRTRAMESLELADAHAAGRGDPFWLPSGGLRNDLIRLAVGFADKTDDSKVKALGHKLLAARPFSPKHGATVRDFLAIGSRDPAELIKVLEVQARIDPDQYVNLTRLYLLTGQPQLALRAASQISITEPAPRHGWKLEDTEMPLRIAIARTSIQAMRAYAAAAAGDNAAKDAYLALARAEVSRFTVPNPARPLPSKERAVRQGLTPVLLAIIADWGHAIALRQGLAEMTFEGLETEFAKVSNKQSLVVGYLEMLAQLERKGDRKGALVGITVDQYLDRAFFFAWNGGRKELSEKLPVVETDTSLGKFDNNMGMWFDGSLTGYSQSREANSKLDIRMIHYETGEGSAPLAEELLALAITRFARKDGYDGFVILSRHTVERTVNSYGSNSSAGYDAQARVLMVRGGQLPEGSNILPERIITLDEVDRTLGPRFKLYADFKAKVAAEEKAGNELRKQAKKAAKNKG